MTDVERSSSSFTFDTNVESTVDRAHHVGGNTRIFSGVQNRDFRDFEVILAVSIVDAMITIVFQRFAQIKPNDLRSRMT